MASRTRRIGRFSQLLVLLAVISVQLSCDSPTTSRRVKSIPTPDKIDFSDLAPGQASQYAFFLGEDYRVRQNLRYEYTGDIMVVEVVAETDTGFVFREYLAPGSPSLYGGGIYDADSVYHYIVRLEGDAIELGPYQARFYRSRLFLDYPFGLPLDEIRGVEAEVISWVTSIPYCECYNEGHVLDYKHGGDTYDRLNLVVDDRMMQTDGPGLTFLYSREAGVVRTSRANWWTGGGTGWDLISPERRFWPSGTAESDR